MAMFPNPPVRESNELHPRAVLPATVQPRTMPATVGVAAEAPPAAPQQMALEPSDIRTWPAEPQEPAQSMMPAPGLMAPVLVPDSQQNVVVPIANWQLPELVATDTQLPMTTLSHPVSRAPAPAPPAWLPIRIFPQPVVSILPAKFPRAVFASPVVFCSA